MPLISPNQQRQSIESNETKNQSFEPLSIQGLQTSMWLKTAQWLDLRYRPYNGIYIINMLHSGNKSSVANFYRSKFTKTAEAQSFS